MDTTRYDDAGNPYGPTTCPCCQGADEYNPHALCDACAVAALAGQYPHGCDHEDNCTHHARGGFQ